MKKFLSVFIAFIFSLSMFSQTEQDEIKSIHQFGYLQNYSKTFSINGILAIDADCNGKIEMDTNDIIGSVKQPVMFSLKFNNYSEEQDNGIFAIEFNDNFNSYSGASLTKVIFNDDSVLYEGRSYDEKLFCVIYNKNKNTYNVIIYNLSIAVD